VWGRAQLGEPAADALGSGRLFDRIGQQPQEVVISTEVGEVFECEVDGADQRAGVAQLAQLVALSLPAGHAMTIRPSADRSLSQG
jgi:hypothetical protein